MAHTCLVDNAITIPLSSMFVVEAYGAARWVPLC